MSFLKPGCAIEGIWKTGTCPGLAASIFHDSHRKRKKACVKGVDCVKIAFGAAWCKGLRETCDAQNGCLLFFPPVDSLMEVKHF